MRAPLLPCFATVIICTGALAAEVKVESPLPQSKLTPLAKPHTVERLRPLYSLSIDNPPAGGKETKLKIEELQRGPRTSRVAYTFTSGSSVGSSMTVVFALYRVALDRGAKFFVVLQSREDANPTEFLVGFSDEKLEEPASYFEASGPLLKDLKWWSVAELEPLFQKAR